LDEDLEAEVSYLVFNALFQEQPIGYYSIEHEKLYFKLFFVFKHYINDEFMW